MSDSSKAQKLKLANSRKRFKELQELKKKKDASLKPSEKGDGLTATNSLTSSTHSSVNNDHDQPCDQPIETIDSFNATQLPNYFASQNTVAFFDSLSTGDKSENVNETPETTKVFDYFTDASPQTHSKFEDMVSNIITSPKPADKNDSHYTLFSQDNQHSYIQETQDIIRPNEVAPLEDCGNVEESCNMFEENRDADSNLFSSQSRQSLLDYLRSDEKVPVTEGEEQDIEEEIIDISNLTQAEVQHSSKESLKQLSNQMADMIDTEYTASSSITDLEKRNLELVSLLEQEKSKTDQQAVLIEELQDTVLKLQDSKTNNGHVQLASELSRLKEELQCHTETVAVLVAEKTELLATVSSLEVMLKGKTADCEELQGRLKTSRSRVADLEREVNSLKSEKHQHEHMDHQFNEQFGKLTKENRMLKEQNDEIRQDLLEVEEKLKKLSEENVSMHQQNQELSNKLSLANIKIQQITNGQTFVDDTGLQRLLQEKSELEKQIAQLNSILNTLTRERDESNAHYQQYVQQLNAQVTNLTNKVEQLQQANEDLSIQEQSRIKHIGELERQLQSLQSERAAFSASGSNVDMNLRNELERLQEMCAQLQAEKTSADEIYTKACNERNMLTKELVAKCDAIGQLESEIERLRGNQPDSAKLLATMESDKVAAARAIKQNSELKEQVEGMKEVLAKLDADKVELTEKLNREVNSNRELLEKLQKTELQLQRLTDAIEIKDRELAHLRETSEELKKQVIHQEQLTDRLRHYEAQDSSSHVLQNELQEAKQTIIKLTNMVNTLKNGKDKVDDVNNSNKSTLETNETTLRKKLEALGEKDQLDNSKLRSERSEDIIDNNCNDTDDVLDKEVAMSYLEDKLKRTMNDIANLTDEKQRLEHLVLQLQGETETIGEYVALYQHQRMVLKQRALEKDQQLKQLASDREQMKIKLDRLKELIRRLIDEKGSVSEELLRQHEHLTIESNRIEYPDENSDHKALDETVNHSRTAHEIIELLSEIKSSNLVEPSDSIHHCPWCSGKLLTV